MPSETRPFMRRFGTRFLVSIHDLAAASCRRSRPITAHATVEEELFYPAARDVLPEDDLVDEPTVEHACAKELIAQIEGMEPSDELYDAKVKVLGEYIDHHVKEEEEEMFPKIRKSGIDLKELGDQLKARKDELLAQLESASA